MRIEAGVIEMKMQEGRGGEDGHGQRYQEEGKGVPAAAATSLTTPDTR